MAEKNQPWSAARMLEAWGLRTSGGSLRNPLKLSTGGSGGCDEEWQAMRYVEAVKGYERSLPVLRWVYVQGQPIETFRLRGPGEPLMRALVRNEWASYIDFPAGNIPDAVLSDFIDNLEKALARRPFTPIHEPEEEDAEMIASTAGKRIA